MTEEELQAQMGQDSFILMGATLAAARAGGLRATAIALTLILDASGEYGRRIIPNLSFDNPTSPTSDAAFAKRVADGEDVDAVLADISAHTVGPVDAARAAAVWFRAAGELAGAMISNAVSYRGTTVAIATMAMLIGKVASQFSERVYGVSVDVRPNSMCDYAERIANGASVDSVLRMIGNASELN